MIYLDATAIDTFLQCREKHRQRYLENRASTYPSIHLAFGHSVHVAVEACWDCPACPECKSKVKGHYPLKGCSCDWHEYDYWRASYEQAMKLAAEDMEKFPEHLLTPPDQQKWRDLALALPEMVAAYFDGVEFEEGAEVEQEWSEPYLGTCDCDPAHSHIHDEKCRKWFPNVALCGKIDRYHKGILYDVKTASEIGRTWKSDYRATLLRTFQFGLYDWYLRQRDGVIDVTKPSELTKQHEYYPSTCKIEVLVKPYKGKPARLEVFDLPEITVYRKRFEQQLAWVVTEIVRYHEQYAEQKPWPMASSQTCQGKFSACEYIDGCNKGWTPKVLEGYKTREEHLEILKATS